MYLHWATEPFRCLRLTVQVLLLTVVLRSTTISRQNTKKTNAHPTNKRIQIRPVADLRSLGDVVMLGGGENQHGFSEAETGREREGAVDRIWQTVCTNLGIQRLWRGEQAQKHTHV